MKYSRQRDLILKALRENVVHPTAEFIYTVLKEKEPNLSLATVYRNLNLLANEGIIRKIEGLDGVAHFDHNTHNHYHFICSKCNKVYDVPYDIAPDLAEKVLAATGMAAESCEITFKGLCCDCKKVN